MLPLRDTNPSRRSPLVTVILIAVNAAVFAGEVGLPEPALAALFEAFGMIPVRLSAGGWMGAGEPFGLPLASVFTSLFLHGGFLHAATNLWTLWIFGDNVEDRLGHLRFLAFYLVSGLGAGLLHWAADPVSAVPTVGASGAISGVLGAYIVLFPRARVLTLVPIFFWPLFIEVPALVYLGLWFLGQLGSGVLALAAAGRLGGIAWWAHIGGFGVGLLGHRLFLPARRAPVRLG